MDIYSLAFSVSNLGPKSYQKVLHKFGDSEKGWNGSKKEYEEIGIKGKTSKTFEEFRETFKIVQYTVQLKNAGVEFVSFLDKRYPKVLKKIDSPPIGLFCKGNVSLLDSSHLCRMTIGVVGARKITQYGRNVTESLVSELVQNGFCIVSGLALGVDATAHRTCLKNNGKTIAVLGCGVDCCNPSENYSLYSDILKNVGLIISEYPLGMPPNKGTFPARNRIIAAISSGVLITEAAEDSGSLITADYALEYGKKVFAVPGPINSQMAKGSLKLLKQGAKLVTEGKDILEEFKMQSAKNKIESQKLKSLNVEEKKIVSLLESEDLTIDEISKKTKLPVTKLFISISNLELRGIVKNSRGKITLLM